LSPEHDASGRLSPVPAVYHARPRPALCRERTSQPAHEIRPAAEPAVPAGCDRQQRGQYVAALKLNRFFSAARGGEAIEQESRWARPERRGVTRRFFAKKDG